MNYLKLRQEFNESHLSHANVLVHIVTSFGFYASMIRGLELGFDSSLDGNYLKVSLGITIFYYLSMLPFIASRLVSGLTFTVLAVAYCTATITQWSPWMTLSIFVASYISQDLAHYFTSEPTYQSKYTPGNKDSPIQNWPEFALQLFLHSYFMLPLVFESAINVSLLEAFLSWFLVVDRMIKLKLDSPDNQKNLKVIHDWLDSQNLAPDVTTHAWFEHLPLHVKKAFDELANDQKIFNGFNGFFNAPEYKTEVLADMNEIYVAATDTSKATSDNVFYSNHVDGPFMCYPFASVYRAIVAVNHNDFIKTIFPAHPVEKCLTDGEMWAFDFNREVHRIEQVKPPTGRRYTLKLHYLVYLSSVPFYGRILGQLTSWYDTLARLAFLQTLVPKNIFERGLWGLIMLMTRLFYGSIRAAGNSGAISFLALTAIIMYFTQSDFPLFLMSSSFIHYFIYISTYYHYETHRSQIAFEGFKSTVMFYKAVAFYHLIINYVATMNGTIDFISLGMIGAGFGLSGCAAHAIGLDQTYFGVELGRCKPGMRVTGFPYNLTAHPMIIGNIIGLLGFMKQDGFRTELPWLVPVHIAFYTLHMLQEHFDFKKAAPVELKLKEE